ncbi:peroxisomal membrane protein PEX13-like [Tropilaelaps mercedesae]|uniref:Peroxisomal membrane protein PEX13 n=1 Tax=Tropilaelaps mercedesae TaxID=418985 RepID=A0A1V9Y2A2_9ACAR|nr:peroxisomal membrane protein PEX13-like [Tropilaelaps mercedesae]
MSTEIIVKGGFTKVVSVRVAPDDDTCSRKRDVVQPVHKSASKGSANTSGSPTSWQESMSAPPKTWETAAAATSSMPQSASLPASASSSTEASASTGGVQPAQSPPPLPPPRPDVGLGQLGAYGGGYSSYSPFMNRYGGVGYGSYGGYGMGGYGGYSSYGGYGSYGAYGATGGYGGGSEVARIAEDSTRSAFQSVEALVHAFSSISMMLESTYFALHSSFRAVIGVADHFSRVRDQLAQVLTALSIVRTLRWIIQKTLYLLGLLKDNPEHAWESAASRLASGAQELGAQDPPRSSWPVISFFAVVLGAPWLIYRMFASSGVQSSARWASGEVPHFLGVAQYDFAGENERELSFKAGSHIRLAPKNLQPRVRGWLLGSVDGQRTGLVPANYLKIIGPSHGQTELPSPPVSFTDFPGATLSPGVQQSPSMQQLQPQQQASPGLDPMETSSTSLYNEYVQVDINELDDSRRETYSDKSKKEEL